MSMVGAPYLFLYLDLPAGLEILPGARIPGQVEWKAEFDSIR
jgi:hypothetical protein